MILNIEDVNPVCVGPANGNLRPAIMEAPEGLYCPCIIDQDSGSVLQPVPFRLDASSAAQSARGMVGRILD